MTAESNVVFRKVREWVQRAEEDLRMAEEGSRLRDPPCHPIAFLAQQCAEKYLKAFLVLKKVDFPYTHNISLLLEVCRPHAQWVSDLTEAGRLTDYAVTARYPGIVDDVSSKDASTAISLAREVRKTVRKALGPAITPPGRGG